MFRTTAIDSRIRIAQRKNHARYTRLEQRLGTRRRAPNMIAGFERHIGGCATRPRACGAQCQHFGMRLARAPMPTLADDFATRRHYTAYARIRMRRVRGQRSQLQCALHRPLVGCGE